MTRTEHAYYVTTSFLHDSFLPVTIKILETTWIINSS